MTAPPRRPRAVASLLRRSILLTAAVATLLFALPLAVAISGLYRAEAGSELARDAERVRARVTDEQLREDEVPRVRIPPAHSDDVRLGIYAADGRRVAGDGPAEAERSITRVARTGLEHEATIGGWLVVGVGITGDDGAAGYVVRAAEPTSEVRYRTYLTWLLMAGLALMVLVVVALLARAMARRIEQPLQRLAAAADQLGHGDFSVRAAQAGVVEIDEVSANLERTARRLGGLMERERAFSADASHQLRTPLTAVRVGLESAIMTPGADLRGAALDALDGLDRLEQTVLDLIQLSRDTSRPDRVDVGAIVAEAVPRWERPLAGRGRRLDVVVADERAEASASPAALRTVLDVLIDNAMAHGAGTVTVHVRPVPDAVVVEVRDEGPGVTGDPSRIFARRWSESGGSGIGLALARSLMEADGGRLELTRAAPTTFAVLLPRARPPARWQHPADAATAGQPDESSVLPGGS